MNAETMPPNLTLIGGEMLGVADGGFVGGPALDHLIATALPPAARVLVAGPHQESLVRALVARGARVTCLLRAYADAEAIAIALPDVRVLAGSLSKLQASEPYDAVIALDGCGRLCSIEGPQLRWNECLEALTATLAPYGTLLLAVANPLGLDRLVALPDTLVPVRTHDGTAPASVAEIGSRLESELSVHAVYAGYPLPTAPTLLISADPPAAELLSVLAAEACAHGFAGRPVLTDPRTIAATAVRSGAATHLAPVWIAAATRAGTPSPTLPATVVATPSGDADFTVAYEISTGGIRSVRRPVPEHRSGSLERDTERLTGPLPSGRLLLESLLATASRADGTVLRQTLRGYVSWLATQDDPVMATPANVVVDGDAYTLLDPSWRWTGTVTADVARAHALRQLATELVAGGFRHPWTSTVSVDDLTALLAAAAGHPVDGAAIAAAIDLCIEIRTVKDGLDADGRDALRTHLTMRQPVSSRMDLDGYRELRAVALRDHEDVERLQVQNAWYATNLAKAEKQATALDKKLTYILGTDSYKLSVHVMATVTPVTNRIRRVRRKLFRR